MRVAQVFKRVLGLGRSRVKVTGAETSIDRHGREVVVVDLVRPAGRLHRCPGCRKTTLRVHDRRMRRWRHLDCGALWCVIRSEVCRIDCSNCGIVDEKVPWARAGSRFTRAFEDTALWLVKSAPKSSVSELLRCDWETISRMVTRVVDAVPPARSLKGLRRIGIDEVRHRRPRRFLTVVVDHDSGSVVWVDEGARAETLERFFRALGPAASRRLSAISLDGSRHYLPVVKRRAPRARICADPFHLVVRAQFALDRVRARQWQRLRRENPEAARFVKDSRFALRRGPATRTEADLSLIEELAHENQAIYRAWLWVEQFRHVLRSDDVDAARTLLAALAAEAHTLGHVRFTRLGAAIVRDMDQILNTIACGLSNGRIEAMNANIRLIVNRSRGFRRTDNLIALIHLIHGRIEVALPHAPRSLRPISAR
jgi:transposase